MITLHDHGIFLSKGTLCAESPVSPRMCPQMTESDSPMRNSAAIANVAAGRKDRNLDVAKVI